MKRTINVNLGGRPFQITEDAYTRLDDYLKSISACLKHNDYGEEIANDIEARIGELCNERLQQSRAGVIDIELVNEMINRMGNPEAMLEDDERPHPADTANTNEKNGDKKENDFSEFFNNIKQDKKYYLDKEKRMIGGVVSGIAAYLKTDVTILRIIAVILIAAIGPVALLGYLLVWAIAPTAETTTDRLRMQGIEPTPENIADKLTNEKPKREPVDTESDTKKQERLKNIILAGTIVVASFIFGPQISIKGSNPFLLYILGISATLTFALFVTLIAFSITKLFSEKYKRIIIISFTISLLITIILAANVFAPIK